MRERRRSPDRLPRLEIKHNAEFVRTLFAETWKKIPVVCREVIREYLSARPAIVYLCFRMDATSELHEPFARVRYLDNKTIITFLEPLIYAEPKEPIFGVMAHEFSHIYRRAKGLWSSEPELEERESSALSKEWGFRECSTNGVADEWIEKWREENMPSKGHLTEKRLFEAIE